MNSIVLSVLSVGLRLGNHDGITESQEGRKLSTLAATSFDNIHSLVTTFSRRGVGTGSKYYDLRVRPTKSRQCPPKCTAFCCREISLQRASIIFEVPELSEQ